MAEKNSLWKNIRNKAKKNRETGAKPKQPTTEMLRQGRNIKAKQYAEGSFVGEDDRKKRELPKRNEETDAVTRESKQGLGLLAQSSEDFDNAVAPYVPTGDLAKQYYYNNYSPVEYPNPINAAMPVLKTAWNLINPATSIGREQLKAKLTSLSTPNRPIGLDKEGNPNIGEEAWKKALGLPTKEKYIVKSQYKPSSATDPNAEYYTINPNVIDKQKIIDYVKSEDFMKRSSEGKSPNSRVTNMDTFSDFVQDDFITKEGYKQGIEDYYQIDPIQKFQISKAWDPEKKKWYASIYDKYDFDSESVNKAIKPYEIYDRVYYDSNEKPIVEKQSMVSKVAQAYGNPFSKKKAEGGPVGEDELPTYRYANKEGVIGGPRQRKTGTELPVGPDGLPIVNMPEFEVISTGPNTNPNPYSPTSLKEATQTDAWKAAKLGADAASLYGFYPANVAGSAMDLMEGDYSGAAMGLVPVVGRAGKHGKFWKDAYTKGVNAGLPHKVILPLKKYGKQATILGSNIAQAADSYDDLVEPYIGEVKDAVSSFNKEQKATGGYYPTQGPPKALFKGYAQGGYTNPYNQYQDDPYLNYADGGYTYAKGGFFKKAGNFVGDVFKAQADYILGTVGSVTGIKSMQDIIDEDAYSNKQFNTGANFAGKLAGTALKYIPVTAPFAAAAGVAGNITNTVVGIDRKNYDPSKHQSGLDIAGDVINTAGNIGTMFVNPSGAAKEGAAAAKNIYAVSDVAKTAGEIGKVADTASKAGQAIDTASTVSQIGQAAATTAEAANTASNIANTADIASNLGEAVQTGTQIASTAAPIVDSSNKLSSGLKYSKDYYSAVENVSKFTDKASKYGNIAQAGLSVVQPIMQQQQAKQQATQQKQLAETPETPVSTEFMYPKPDANTEYAAINVPTFNTGVPQIGNNINTSNQYFSQGGNITNNSLNLRNTMRYKRFAQGGTLEQQGINFITDDAGLHYQNANGGVPIGPDALAEGGEAKLQMADGGQYIVSGEVDGANTQSINGETMTQRLKKKLKPFMMGGLASNPKDKENLRRPFDSYSAESIAQVKDNAIQETEAIRMQRGGAVQYAAHGGKLTKDIEKIVMEEYTAAYGGTLPNKYKGKVNMPNSYAKGGGIHIKPENKGKFTASAKAAGHTVQEHARAVLNNPNATPLQKKRANFARNASKWKHADGGYVHNQMTQPMYAEGGPIYGDPASEYTYAYGGMYGNPYARGGQIDYTNDMYSSYAGGGPMPSNLPQAFNGISAQNRGGMYIYADGGMMPPEQQMMQQQQMQQAPQEQMQQQGGQDQMMQMVQQVMEALMQGANPEQIMQQLVQSGVPPEQAQQIIQVAMQEAQGQQQPQGQPMQEGQQMPPQQGMARGGRMRYDGGGTKPPYTMAPISQTTPIGRQTGFWVQTADGYKFVDQEHANQMDFNNQFEFRNQRNQPSIVDQIRQGTMSSMANPYKNMQTANVNTQPETWTSGQPTKSALTPYTDQNELRDSSDYLKQLTANPAGPMTGPVNMYNQYTNPYPLVGEKEERLAQIESNMNRSLNTNANKRTQPSQPNEYDASSFYGVESIDPDGNPVYKYKAPKVPAKSVLTPYTDANTPVNPNDNSFLYKQDGIPMEGYTPQNAAKVNNQRITTPLSGFKPGITFTEPELDVTQPVEQPLAAQPTPQTFGPVNQDQPTAKSLAAPVQPSYGPNAPIEESEAIRYQGYKPQATTTPVTTQSGATPPIVTDRELTGINNRPSWVDIGIGASQLAGAAHQFFQAKPEPFKYDKMQATTLNPTPAIIASNQAQREAQALAEYGTKQNAPTSGSYLANIRALALQSAKQRGASASGIQQQYDIQNANILNQMEQQNTEIENRNIDAIQEDLANFQTQRTNALYNAGANIAGMRRDYKANEINQIIANNIGTSNWKYDKATNTIVYRTPEGQTVKVPVQTAVAETTQPAAQTTQPNAPAQPAANKANPLGLTGWGNPFKPAAPTPGPVKPPTPYTGPMSNYLNNNQVPDYTKPPTATLREEDNSSFYGSNNYEHQSDYVKPPEKTDKETIKAFQDWLDLYHPDEWTKSGKPLKKGKGYGNFGEQTDDAWYTYGKEFMGKVPFDNRRESIPIDEYYSNQDYYDSLPLSGLYNNSWKNVPGFPQKPKV